MVRILELLRIRREEAPLALLVSGYFFLAMASVSLVKSLQNAFYLGRVGFDWKLPSIYVVLALISGLGVLFFRSLSRRYSRIGINAATLVAMIVFLALFFFLFRLESAWVYAGFYLWGGIFSVLVPTLGWMLAYQLYGTRRAKRIFGLLGTGGILGGAFGGYYAAWLGRTEASAEHLLAHVAVFLLAMLGAMLAAARRDAGAAAVPAPAGGAPASAFQSVSSSVRFIFQSRYLTYLAGIVLASACVTTLIDLLYKRLLEEKFSGSPADINQFFGSLLGTIFIFSAIFQLVGTNRVIRTLGIGAGLLTLPLALLGGNVLVLIAGAFWTVVILKIVDGCFRSSLHKTSVELLYVPITDGRTLTVKGIVDLAVFRMGDALGATLFLGLAGLPGTSLYWVGGGALVATLIWAAWSWRIGHEYLKVLRRSLEVRPTPSTRRALSLGERVAERTLVSALASTSAPKVRFALLQLLESTARESDEMLREDYADGIELASQGDDITIPHFTSASPAEPPPWIESVTPILEHREPDIAATALHLLLSWRPEQYSSRLLAQCSGVEIPDLVCLHYLDRYGEPFHSGISTRTLQRWAAQATREQAEVLARVMGKIRRTEFVPRLVEWARGSDRKTACAALRSLGKYRQWDGLEVLLDALVPLWSRSAAREALAEYGVPLVPRLIELSTDSRTDLEIRREIPALLGRLPGRAAVEALVSSLYSSDPVISYRSLKSLNRVRERSGLPFGEVSFSPALQIWVREYYELLNLDILMGDDGGNVLRLARKAVRERLERCTEKIFRGLELFLPPGDAYFSYLGFTGEAPELRENAIELIDLRIRGELRETILPIVTGYNQKEVVQKGRRLYRLSTDLDRVLADALFLADPWLKCCIIAVVRARGRRDLRERVRQACEDINPLVKETAEWALDAWACERDAPNPDREHPT